MAQQPVPMSQIFAQPKIVELNVDKDNKLVLHYGPPSAMITFMLPFPFLCVGCCISQTLHIVFDDTTRTVSISHYPGFCFPFQKKTVLEYSVIANVGYRGTRMRANRVQMYEPVLVTLKGEQFPCGPCNSQHSTTLQGEVLALHRFVFGRQNQDYQPPNMGSLLVPSRQ